MSISNIEREWTNIFYRTTYWRDSLLQLWVTHASSHYTSIQPMILSYPNSHISLWNAFCIFLSHLTFGYNIDLVFNLHLPSTRFYLPFTSFWLGELALAFLWFIHKKHPNLHILLLECSSTNFHILLLDRNLVVNNSLAIMNDWY